MKKTTQGLPGDEDLTKIVRNEPQEAKPMLYEKIMYEGKFICESLAPEGESMQWEKLSQRMQCCEI